MPKQLPTFDSEFFSNSRKLLKDLVTDTDIIVVTANGLLQSAADSTFPFRQDGSFWYLTGINEPDIVLVIEKSKEFLIVPGRSTSREAFDGSIDSAELTKISGVETVLNEEYGWQELVKVLKTASNVASLSPPPAYVEQHGMYTNPARAKLYTKLKDANDQIELIDIRPQLADLRVVKRPLELEAIQQAINITIDALSDVTARLETNSYAHEYEIEADLTRDFRRAGALGHAFTPIVASGKRACTLHNVANDGPLEPGTLVVMDVGADYNHYAADITRTVSVGKVSERHQAVHAAVFRAQEFAISLLKPGALLKENESQVENFLGEELKKLGVIDTVEHEAIRKFYPHASSHFLGLDVHDVGNYTQPLQPGMVVTCEPGIYIADEGIGVRIEDDILITEQGSTNLSAKLPRELNKA